MLGALALFALTLASAARAAAPSPTPSASPSALPEIGHVVTADRHDEPISKTSRPTYVVDRASILAHGARTIADALTGVPGLQLFSYGAFGAQTNYGLLGSTSEQTLVLLDGEPIATASSGTIDLGTFSTVGVSRIEVVESGASTLYGTSAVGGVINIITAVPRGTYLALSDGTLGEREARAEAGNGKFGVAFERHVASNVYAFPAIDGVQPGTRQNADAQQSATRISYASALGSAWNVRLSAGDDAIAIGVPGAVPVSGGFNTLTPFARQHTSRQDLRFNLAHDAAGSTLSLSVAASRENLSYADPSAGGESDTYDARTQISLRDVVQTAHTSLVSGIDLSRESADLTLGPSGPPPEVSAAVAQSAVYTQIEASAGHGFSFNAGVRGEHDAPYGSVLAPSVGVLVNALGLRLAANANESFRAPTILDLYYPGFSNPNLRPEKVRDIDLTLSSPAVLAGASLGFFDRHASDLIEFDSNFRPQNFQHAELQGFVASLHTKPAHGVVTTLSVTDLFRAVDQTPGADEARLPRDPVFQTALAIARPLGCSAFGFGIDFNTVGAHDEAGASGVGAYTNIDAYTRFRLSPQTILSIRGLDLGDERYAPVFGFPAPGRRLEVEVATQ
jgi:vitamin B12 transporter